MEYDLTPEERKRYVAARGRLIVTACPGSGKTTSIVYKLHQLCTEAESSNNHTGVLCLSFTNKAVDEIKAAYSNMHGASIRYPHEVSTIDSFITQQIVMPFWYLYKYCKSAPLIVNEEDVLHDLLWHHYVDGDGHVKDTCNIEGYGNIPRSKSPEKINSHSGKFYYKTSELAKNNWQYAKDVILFRLSKGYLTSADAMCMALSILSDYPIIAESIVLRYPYIIVDEAQDTSGDQFELFAILLKTGLKNLEFIGDINQSIYEWRFACPDKLEALSHQEGWQHIPFVNNRRSVQKIIDLYSRLIPLQKRQPIISTGVEDKGIPIVVYRYDNHNSTCVLEDFDSICKKYALKESLILTRGRNLSKLLSGAKEKPDYWKSTIPKMLINAYVDFKSGFVTEAVRQLAYVWSMLVFKENEYDEKRMFVREKLNNTNDSTFLVNMFFEMPGLDETFQTWTSKMQLYIKEKFELKKIPNFDVYSRKKDFDIKEMANNPLSRYFGNDASGTKSSQIIQTIHSSKGTTTDAVLLFLSLDNRGNNISLNLFSDVEEMSEKHRLLYVACSRARYFLALAVPIAYTEAQIHKLLQNVNYEVRTPGIA